MYMYTCMNLNMELLIDYAKEYNLNYAILVSYWVQIS